MSEAELELRQEVGRGQIALDTMPLGAAGIEDEDGRCPLGAEAIERIGLLLDVGTGRNEVFRDERRDLRIGVDLGFQPSAGPSHRGGGEVEEQRPSGLFGLVKRCVDVSLPGDLHVRLLVFLQDGAACSPAVLSVEGQQFMCHRAPRRL
jgi:hypothetical protein